jgi:hypothetical protein
MPSTSQRANSCKFAVWSGQSSAVLTVIADLQSRIYIFEWKLSTTLHIERECCPAQSSPLAAASERMYFDRIESFRG